MFLLIDKAKGVTSHDVVNAVRKITGEKRVGHGGTLDPNATGLLIVGVTREGTKQLGKITKETTKEYLAELHLGEERTTDDTEGDIMRRSSVIPEKKVVVETITSFVGEQLQVPPIFSAIKMNGKKAYELARKGKDIQMEPRTITVYEAELMIYEYPKLVIRFTVSSGTYIRSLARDIGRILQSFAYLENLRRTKIGNISVADVTPLQHLDSDNWKEYSRKDISL